MTDRAKREAKVWAYFERTSAGDGKVDWRGLQKVLNWALKHGSVKSHKISKCVGCCVDCCLATCCAVICVALGLSDPAQGQTTGNHIVSSSNESHEVREDFSLSDEICKDLINLMGEGGRIHLEDFKVLWMDVLQWNAVFKRFHERGDDDMSEEELKQALYAVGCQLDTDGNFADLLTCYGSRKRSAPFDRFVKCIITSRLKKGATQM